MIIHEVCVHPERDRLPRADQLAWKIAQVAVDPVPVEDAVAEMIVNRIIDNASVAIASVSRDPVVTARDQALSHSRRGAATVFGCTLDVHPLVQAGVWERLLILVQEDHVKLGMTFLDRTNILAHQKAAGAPRKRTGQSNVMSVRH